MCNFKSNVDKPVEPPKQVFFQPAPKPADVKVPAVEVVIPKPIQPHV